MGRISIGATGATLVVLAASATIAGATGSGTHVRTGPPPTTGTPAPKLAAAKPIHGSYVGAALVGPRSYCSTHRARHGDEDGKACVLAAKRYWTYYLRGASAGGARHGGVHVTTAPVRRGGVISNAYDSILWVKPYAKGWHWAWNPALGDVIVPTRALSYYGVQR